MAPRARTSSSTADPTRRGGDSRHVLMEWGARRRRVGFPVMAQDDVPRRLEAVAEAQPPWSTFLGMRLTSYSSECVEAELDVRPEFANRNGVLHGGALMGFADNVGGTASFLNLPEGASATTIESKTNFFRAITVGSTARARCVPLHRGRRTSVWQTTVTTEEGKTAAVVTQTQLLIT